MSRNPYVAVYFSELECLRELNVAAFHAAMERNPEAGQPTASGKGKQGEYRKRKLAPGETLAAVYPTGPDILVWLQIKKHFNPNPGKNPDGPGYAWPGIKRLEEVTGLSRSTVRRSIQNLEGYELLRVITKWGLGNQYHRFACTCGDCFEKEAQKNHRKVLEFAAF